MGAPPLQPPMLPRGGAASGSRLEASAPTPPSEPLERVRPDLEALIDTGSGVPFHQRAWSALSPLEQAALEQLDHSAHSFEQSRAGDLVAVPALWSKAYGELDGVQQAAARTLGIDAPTWERARAARTDLRKDDALGPAARSLFRRPGTLTEQDVEDTLVPALKGSALPPERQREAVRHLMEHHGARLSQAGRLTLRDAFFSPSDVVAGSVSYNGWDTLPVGGTVVNDAGGRAATPMRGVRQVRSPAEARAALDEARMGHAKVSVAGRKHSKGGQTASSGGIQLDMTGMNRLSVSQNGAELRAESGATWAQAQGLLSAQGRSLPVAQGSNIFTVGGSLGVNCHGFQAQGLPLSAFVSSIRLLTPQGQIMNCSPTENPEMFRHALGGYGLFGIILDATIQTQPERPCVMDVERVPLRELSSRMAALQEDP
ncbi:MAG TPA: FAD-binding oxidoreductase, partial [Myxococcaceae bacterium]|nr:FAD-binding oxidoreductase [Myxococcaceae bacterium]